MKTEKTEKGDALKIGPGEFDALMRRAMGVGPERETKARRASTSRKRKSKRAR